MGKFQAHGAYKKACILHIVNKQLKNKYQHHMDNYIDMKATHKRIKKITFHSLNAHTLSCDGMFINILYFGLRRLANINLVRGHEDACKYLHRANVKLPVPYSISYTR